MFGWREGAWTPVENPEGSDPENTWALHRRRHSGATSLIICFSLSFASLCLLLVYFPKILKLNYLHVTFVSSPKENSNIKYYGVLFKPSELDSNQPEHLSIIINK